MTTLERAYLSEARWSDHRLSRIDASVCIDGSSVSECYTETPRQGAWLSVKMERETRVAERLIRKKDRSRSRSPSRGRKKLREGTKVEARYRGFARGVEIDKGRGGAASCGVGATCPRRDLPAAR